MCTSRPLAPPEDSVCLCPSSARGEAPPACDASTDPSTRWRLQYDVYQYFLPENDLSELSLFGGIRAVADVGGAAANAKRVGGARRARRPTDHRRPSSTSVPLSPSPCRS